MNRRAFLALAAAPLAVPRGWPGRDIVSFGAVGDGRRDNRRAIQRAVDACAAAGGGTVYVPPGTFRSGALRLKSGVALWLDRGATLVASASPDAYDVRRPVDRTPRDAWGSVFLLAERAERVAILGPGTIKGAGFARPRGLPLAPFRPRLVAFESCQDVLVRDVTLQDSDRWTLHLHQSDDVRVNGVRIRAGYDVINTDGIDVDGCRRVAIANCDIVVGDDCIVLKTTNYLGEPRALSDVTVSNCVLATRASPLKIGTETHADVANVTFDNCTVYGEPHARPKNAVAIEMVDGARLRGVSVANIAARCVQSPLFIRLGARTAPAAGAPRSSLEQVVVQNLVAVDATLPVVISGVPDRRIAGVTVSGLRLQSSGAGAGRGAPAAPAATVPEVEAGYPDSSMFGPLPAHGVYARHATDLVLRDIDVTCVTPDPRPLLVTDDVDRLRADGLRADGVAVPAPGAAARGSASAYNRAPQGRMPR